MILRQTQAQEADQTIGLSEARQSGEGREVQASVPLKEVQSLHSSWSPKDLNGNTKSGVGWGVGWIVLTFKIL